MPPARTSHTHPLQIAAVRAGEGLGRIGITFCPGKVQQSALTGAWERDLLLDLDAVRAWGAEAVVTLIEAGEMAELRVEGLGDAVAERNMSWFHLPIRDVSVPDARFEEEWKSAGETIRSMIRGGSDVMIHCKGGLGRAGTIAARLLAELGWEPSRAIEAVRSVRPGAIETGAQREHVLHVKLCPQSGHDVRLQRSTENGDGC